MPHKPLRARGTRVVDAQARQHLSRADWFLNEAPALTLARPR